MLCLLLPFLAISVIDLVVYFVNENIQLFTCLGIVIAYLIVGFIAFKLKVINVEASEIRLNKVYIPLLVGVGLFCFYYAEFVFFRFREKPSYDLIAFMYSVVFAPIMEEVFTKIILFKNLLVLKIHPYVAIVITAFYFLVLHAPDMYVVHFVVGLVTTLIYYKNKNLLQVMLIHSLYNLLLTVFSFF